MTDTPVDEPITLHEGMATLHLGDCVEVCKRLAAEGVQVHSVVTDPPYEIGFMGRGWDSAGVAFDPETWKAIGEVLLPGGHLLAFTSTRTYHRIACAIEDAGFEIRDQIQWLYGTGFPKNHNIAKAIDRQTVRDLNGDLVFGRDWDRIYAVTNAIREARDKAGKTNRDIDERFGKTGMAGHWTAAETNSQPAIPQWDQWLDLKQFLKMGDDEDLDNEVWVLNGRKGQPGEGWTEREVLGHEVTADALAWYAEEEREAKVIEITETNTDTAQEWEGWGTALKPANEPIVVARKPISEKTVAQNVVKHGTGAINIDATRVGTMGATTRSEQTEVSESGWRTGHDIIDLQAGRYPPNVILSHTDQCVKTGTKKIERGELRDFSGMDAYPAEAGEKRDVAGDSRNETQKGDNFEIIDIYDCHESCPVQKINETADGSAKFFPNFSPEEVLKGENAPIVVARKPFDGTVANNVLVHGVGGINIDATRIKSDSNPKTWETPRGGIWTTDSEAKAEMVEDTRGRFPTNMILGHSPECVQAGSKRVKTSTGKRGSENSKGDAQGMFGIKATGEEVGYADSDGKEQVEVWECVDGCPVSSLDEQSGISKSAKQPTKGRSKDGPKSQIFGGGNGFNPKEGQICPEYGDEGGASRFFKQVHAIGDWPGPEQIEEEEE